MIIAPAKNILFGEHAVVYPPNTAIIAANSLACKAEVRANNTSSLINVQASGEFSLSQTYDTAVLISYLDSVRREYLKFKESGNISTIRKIINKDDDLLKLSIAVAFDYLFKLNLKTAGFSLFLLSNVPLQSGFGSSAVFSSAVIAEILNFFRVRFNKDIIFNLTMEIEAFQHLHPSGEGPAAVIYGELIQLNKNVNKTPSIKKLKIENLKLKDLMQNLTVIHSGKPDQTTGELVNYVKLNFEDKKEVIEELESNTLRFLELNKRKECEEKEFVVLINKSGMLLEKLGVVSDPVIEYSKIIRDKGGAVKISGAGGQGKNGSGALLVYHSDRDWVKKITEEFGFKFFDIKFGGDGIRIIK
ncbi:hypothetical protein KBD45_05120 [Candidatus Dojkabacteria bacterium]|nr:hypothetical protein [Candidatus Dojkabacteria bacterium]